MKISIVLMAAGMSSRFGGQPKILSKIGPNNESLFEMSFLQIKDCLQIEQIHLILNEKTGMDIYDEVQKVVKKYNYTVLLTYRFQKIPHFRLKPWGTAEALSLAHEYVEHPCLVLNSDDLFNKKVFENIKEKCIENKNYVIGFRLGGTLSKGQKANRAFINCDEKENVNSVLGVPLIHKASSLGNKDVIISNTVSDTVSSNDFDVRLLSRNENILLKNTEIFSNPNDFNAVSMKTTRKFTSKNYDKIVTQK